MRDSKRIPEILCLIYELWNLQPDIRFCQFIYNLLFIIMWDDTNKIFNTSKFFYFEDNDLIKLLRDQVNVRRKLGEINEC